MLITETENIYLSELKLSDGPFILNLVNQKAWIKYIGDRKIHSIEEAQSYIRTGPQTSYTQNGFGLWLVRLKNNNIPLGICGFLKRDYLSHPDIGYAISEDYYRQGFTAEAVHACLQYGAKTLKFPEVFAITSTDNVASINLLTNLNFQFQKIVKSNNTENNLYHKSLTI